MDKEKKEFAKRLKKIMIKKNITAYGLAKMSGLSRQLISNYLHGRSFPKFEQLEKIATSLNINVFNLLTDISTSDAILNILQSSVLPLFKVKHTNDYMLDFIKANVSKNSTLDTMVNLPVLRFCSCLF